MIYGVVPAGGLGTRLGLPYPKEMLPIVGIDHYEPIISCIVSKMLDAGADKIYFVHDIKPKKDIIDYFSSKNFIHIQQQVSNFVTVLKDFYNSAQPKSNDRILLGMGDSIISSNPYHEMLCSSGIVCGMFTADASLEVERLLYSNNQIFDAKSKKTSTNLDEFWGVLKFDGENIANMVREDMFIGRHLGGIINKFNLSFVKGNSCIDIGTWEGYNKYIKSVS